MSQPNELRLFISSTFRDMQEEREHLVKKIFPEIRALCRNRGVTFTEIDLRWGLTDEEAILGQVVRTCLEEIDRCRPLFLGMIGNRYGWVPEFHEIAMDPDLLTRYPWVEEVALEGKSVTEMEFIHGVFNAPSGAEGQAFFYQRTSGDGEIDDPERLTALIDRLQTAGHPLHPYGTIEELGAMVERDLLTMIDHYWPEEAAPSPLEVERRAHAAFSASRTRAYIPNPLYLKEFNDWQTEGEGPLLILGPSGLGKSSLIAWLAETFRKKNRNAFVVEHYVGATEKSGSAVAVMRHIIEEICERFGIVETIPEGEGELERSFANWLYRLEHLASEEKIPILIAIDAINQLGSYGRRLTWLPTNVPGGVQLLLSTTPGESEERLLQREWRALRVTPPEDERVRQSILVRYLGEFRKSISAEQLRRITADPRAGSPLYLRVVAEELRLHGNHETIDEVIDQLVGEGDLLGTFDAVLRRVERDHGEEAVRSFLPLLGISRSGLAESELLELTGLNRLQLSRLLFAFDYHLLRNDGLLTFFHNFLRRGVEERYLSDPDRTRELREELVAYFATITPTSRVALELITHYRQLGNDAALATLLARPDITHLLNTGETRFELMAEWTRLDAIGYHPSDLYRATTLETGERVPAVHATTVAELLDNLGEWGSAEEIYRSVIDRAEEEREERDLMQSHLGVGRIRMQRGEYNDALSSLEHAVEIAQTLGERRGEQVAVGSIGIVHAHRGAYEEALRCYGEQKRISQEMHDRSGILTATGNAGLIYGYRGEREKALACHREILTMARDIGDRRSMATALGNIGMLQAQMNLFEEALENHHRSLAISRELGERDAIARGYGNLGEVFYKRGQLGESLDYYQKQLALSEELGNRRSIAWALGHIADIYLQSGKLEEGSKSYERMLSIAQEIDDRRAMSSAMGGLASTHYMRRDYEEATIWYHKKIAIATEIGDRSGAATALGNLGLTQKGMGEFTEALDSFEQQFALYTELNDARGIGIAHGCMAELHYEQERKDEALTHFLKAYNLHAPIDFRFGLVQWSLSIAQILCELCREGNEVPESMTSGIREALGNSDISRQNMLARATTLAAESHEIALSFGNEEILLATSLVVEEGAALSGDAEGAVRRLKEMKEKSRSSDHVAAIDYKLWEITGEERWRVDALLAFRKLHQERPAEQWRRRIVELEREGT